MELLFWNVDRLSASDTRTRRRFDRVMAEAASRPFEVLGLTEVNRSPLARLCRFGSVGGFEVLHREEDECRVHAVLLIALELRVTAHATVASIDRRGRMRSEAVMASVEDLSGRELTVSAVYNYSPWPQVLDGVQDFSDRRSGGSAVIGGDFNMARSLDSDPGLAHLGTAAFDLIGVELGWEHVPADPGGDEVPTWPVGPGPSSSPRQLDHLFVKGVGDASEVVCSVVAPPTEKVRLSDHAMLRAQLLPSAA
ncbi:MAG: endonuclease/exonuclease/phosphatase family protein [Kocuria sp.]|nr:endonuclease/exonuclease/phosphatase family protein [Kocuria sp.]